MAVLGGRRPWRRGRSEPSVRVRELAAASPERPTWQAPWPLVTIAAALITAMVGWLLMVGLCLLGWIVVPELGGGEVFRMAAQGWLLAHGIPISLPGAWLSIPPLGLTLIAIVTGLGGCRFAVLHGHAPSEPDERPRRAVRMGCLFALAYVIALLGVRAWVGASAPSTTLAPVVVIVLLLGVGGCARSLHWDPFARLAERWAWTRAIVPALVAGLCVMVVAGALVLTVSLVSGRTRIETIHDSLSAGVIGGVMLILVQLAWLPNYILWCGSWALGAGVQLGLDTVISPAQSYVGMLPAIPVLGAVPPAGPAPRLGMLCLLSGVVAGAVAAFVVVTSQVRDAASRGRLLGADVGAISGALSGIVTGLVFVLLQVPASGDLGSVRLVDLGARMGALVIMAPSSMGVAGMVTGWLIAWRVARRPDRQALDTAAMSEAVTGRILVTRQRVQPGGAGEEEQSTRVVADKRPPAGGSG